jgi:hypothetical protein
MSNFFEGVAGEVVTGLVALPVGYFARVGVSRLRDRLHARAVIDLFGLGTGPLTIMHSTILDQSRDSYNYPSSDTRAARIISRVLDDAYREEDRDFVIQTDRENIRGDRIDPNLWNSSLILLCGPKRNTAVGEALAKLRQDLNYTLAVDEVTGENTLRDNRRGHMLVSSREEPEYTGRPDGYDYGLILSVENAISQKATVTILAGIHGAGTLGCAQFLRDGRNIRELIRRRKNGVIAEVILRRNLTTGLLITRQVPI